MTLNEQVKRIKTDVKDKELKAALLQSINILITANNPNDNAVVARLDKRRAVKFKEFLDSELTAKEYKLLKEFSKA